MSERDEGFREGIEAAAKHVEAQLETWGYIKSASGIRSLTPPPRPTAEPAPSPAPDVARLRSKLDGEVSYSETRAIAYALLAVAEAAQAYASMAPPRGHVDEPRRLENLREALAALQKGRL
jgi:hypothetical protein